MMVGHVPEGSQTTLGFTPSRVRNGHGVVLFMVLIFEMVWSDAMVKGASSRVSLFIDVHVCFWQQVRAYLPISHGKFR